MAKSKKNLSKTVNKKQTAKQPVNANATTSKQVDRPYYVALTRPFDAAAYGARVPDLYSAPTVTSHIRKLVTITSDASGNVSGIVLPSLITHALVTDGTFSGSDVIGWTRWTGSSKASAAVITNSGGVKAKLSNARIVSYGVRFRNLASMTNVSGRATFATLPIKDDMLVPNATNIGGQYSNDFNLTAGAWFSAAGVPYSGSNDNAVIAVDQLASLPNNFSVTSMELSTNGLDIVPKVTTPYAFGLRNTDDSAVGNDVNPGVATGAIYAGDDDYAKFGGFESVLFGGSGFPATTAVMTLEVVYHVEGTPTLAAGSGLVPDAMPKANVNMQAFYGALDMAARAASFSKPVLDAARRALPLLMA